MLGRFFRRSNGAPAAATEQAPQPVVAPQPSYQSLREDEWSYFTDLLSRLCVFYEPIYGTSGLLETQNIFISNPTHNIEMTTLTELGQINDYFLRLAQGRSQSIRHPVTHTAAIQYTLTGEALRSNGGRLHSCLALHAFVAGDPYQSDRTRFIHLPDGFSRIPYELPLNSPGIVYTLVHPSVSYGVTLIDDRHRMIYCPNSLSRTSEGQSKERELSRRHDFRDSNSMPFMVSDIARHPITNGHMLWQTVTPEEAEAQKSNPLCFYQYGQGAGTNWVNGKNQTLFQVGLQTITRISKTGKDTTGAFTFEFGLQDLDPVLWSVLQTDLVFYLKQSCGAGSVTRDQQQGIVKAIGIMNDPRLEAAYYNGLMLPDVLGLNLSHAPHLGR